MYNKSMSSEIDKKDLNKKDPEFNVRMVLSSFEADTIRAMRRYKWARLEITIQNGQPRHGKLEESIIFTELGGAEANVEGKILESKSNLPIIDEDEYFKKQEVNSNS